ncbi:MAG: hypothetical protein JW940_37305 [Polyangiaceae bacterium]|nr:hypothetical protein [Polyangiaceae bacterium]
MRAEQVIRTLLALPELELRCQWLRFEIERLPRDAAAVLLNALCEQSERGSPSGREAMMAVALCVAALGDCELTDELRAQAERDKLLSLDRLLRRGPAPEAAESGQEDVRVPDYGLGRELTLGERRSLARRPNRRAFERLLADPHPLVVRQLLTNPLLTEDDVVKIAARRPARPPVTRELAASVRWLKSARVRAALVHNPGSPEAVTVPLLALCTRQELASLLDTSGVSLVLRATALELLERMPPLRPGGHGSVVQ